MSSSQNTYVFGVSPRGVLAAGVGTTMAEARRDAIARFQIRFPAAQRDFAASQLLAALKHLDAPVLARVNGDLPAQEYLSGYMSPDTWRVAAVLASTGSAHECVRAAWKQGGAGAACDALHKQFHGVVRSERADPGLVDWTEVLASVYSPADDELAGESVTRICPEAEDATGAIPRRTIEEDVMGVLRYCAVEGNGLKLPPGKLDRKLYERVNEVLVAMGGKWVGRKVQAHVFEESPVTLLDVVLSTGSYIKPQDLGYFETQRPEVERLIELAQLEPGQKGLEPSAGRGAIAIEMAKILGFDSVTVVELLQGNANKLREAGFSAVNRSDFLSIDPVPIYDRIVMNPPFSRLADIAHVMHAARFLKPDGRLVAITSPSWTFNSAKKAEAFRDFVVECDGEVEEVEAGAFQAVGTNIATRIVAIDACNFPWYRESAPVVERMRG